MTVLYSDLFNKLEGSAPDNLVLSQANGSGGTMNINGTTGRFRNISSASATFHTLRGILPSIYWNRADGKATMFFTTAATATDLSPQIMLRTSGAWDAQVDSPTTGYKLVYWQGNIEIYRRISGATLLISSSVPFPLSPSTTYGMTLQCVGTATDGVKGRIWNAISGEPPGWQVQADASIITTPGQFMMAFVNTVAVAAIRQVEWDNLTLDDLVSAVPTGPTPRLMRI
jgi:hypothetical protein